MRFAESGSVRDIIRSTEGSAWNVPVTVVDAQVGGGFPKSEKSIQGTPETLRVFRGCAVVRMRGCAEESTGAGEIAGAG